MQGPASADSALAGSEALARLARSERGLRQLVENAPHPTLLVGYEGLIALANPAAAAMFGVAAAELAGTPVEGLIAPEDRGAHRARRQSFASDPPVGPVAVLRMTMLRADGRPIPAEVALAGVETADGAMMCVTVRDVAPDLRRERQDAALRRISGAVGAETDTERLLGMVVEEAAALLDADKALVARFAEGEVVVVGSHGDHRTMVGDVIPPDSGSSLLAVSRTGETTRLRYDDLPPGDPIRELALSQDHHEAVAVPIAVHTRLWGALMVASGHDIPAEATFALTRFAEFAGAMIGAAESRAVETALRESEERFRQLADLVPPLLWTADAHGACDFVSQRWVEYAGAPAEELLGSGWLERVHPDDRDRLAREWTAAVEVGEPVAIEFRLRRHDGVYRRFETRAQPMRDESGAIVKWFGSNSDVEDSRAAAQAVRSSEAQLRAALGAGHMGAWTLDVTDGVFQADRNVRLLYGIEDDVPPERVREVLRSRIHPDDRQRVSTSFARALEGMAPEYRAEYRVVTPEMTRWIEARGRVTRNSAGEARTVTGVVVDITEQRQAGERQLRSQKLEALGTLSGGIAHDFNNLLQVIGGNVGIARAELPADAPAQDHLGTVERATQRAADLVGRILAYSRPDGDSRREHIALDSVVEEALDLLRPTLPAMIELRSWYGGGLAAVNADRAGVTQVVTNLATNAAQAIGRRAGTIEFRIATVELSEEETRTIPELSPGAWVRLTVSDDGPGMDAATLARAFDPFFTTKDPGEGTGLGLSIVHSVMSAHGGAVVAYSEPGVGTAFRLYFPIDAAGGPVATAPPEPPDLPARTGRILFVDDEPDLVALHERSLGRVGHEVTGFTDPRVALELFRADPSAFDAVVTDLSMPGITGLELAREVLALRPEIPVVIVSGYIPPDERAEAEALGVRDMLPKPSPIARLRDVLNRALGGPG